MKTIDEVLRFLNYLDVVDDVSDSENNNFSDSRKVLSINFQQTDFEELIHMLSTNENILIRFLERKLENIEELTENLREKTLELYKKKKVEEREERAGESNILHHPVKIREH